MKIEVSVRDVIGLLHCDISRDVKGNDVVSLEILGQQVLLAPRSALGDSLDTDDIEERVGTLLARKLGQWLLDTGCMEGWSLQSPTGRDVYGLTRRDDGML